MADNWEGKTPDGLSWRYKRNRKGEKLKGANGRYVKVYGWRTTIDGTEARVKPSEDLEAVRAERDQIRTSRRKGTYVDRRKGEILFKDQAAVWLEAKKETIDPDGSVEVYESRFRTINKLIGDKTLNELTPQVLQKLVKDLVARGNQPKQYFRLVCAVLRDAINKDIIVRKDPKVGVILPSPPPRKPKSLSKEEFEAAEEAVRSDDFLHTVFTTLAETGARLSEGLGLCEDQLDEDTDEINIDRQIARHYKTKEFYLKEPKSKSGIRTMDASVHLNNTLTTYVADHPPGEFEMTFRYRNGDIETRPVRLIFTTHDGKPVTRWYFRWRLKKALKKAGIKLTPHQLRHTLATLLIGDGVDVKTVQAILGHARAAITLDMYADPSVQGKAAARKALARRRIKVA